MSDVVLCIVLQQMLEDICYVSSFSSRGICQGSGQAARKHGSRIRRWILGQLLLAKCNRRHDLRKRKCQRKTSGHLLEGDRTCENARQLCGGHNKTGNVRGAVKKRAIFLKPLQSTCLLLVTFLCCTGPGTFFHPKFTQSL